MLHQNATQCHLRLSNSQFNLPSNCWVFRCRTSNLLQEYFYFKRWLLLQNIPPPKTGHVRCSRKCIEIQFHRHSMMRGLISFHRRKTVAVQRRDISVEVLKGQKDKRLIARWMLKVKSSFAANFSEDWAPRALLRCRIKRPSEHQHSISHPYTIYNLKPSSKLTKIKFSPCSP